MQNYLTTISQFSSFGYIGFLLAVVALYYVFKRSALVLLLASIAFYATLSVQYAGLFLLLCLINYFLGILLSKNPRKIFLYMAIVLNIGILVFFRYTNFIFANLPQVGLLNLQNTKLAILAPLGISFFTFEFLHYLIDVYKGNAPIKNIKEFILFPFFFPTLIAGPIKRYENFLPQLRLARVNWDTMQNGVLLIIKGLYKKVVLADSLAIMVAAGFDSTASWWTTLIAVYAFTFQIYFDFSAYTDIGRGSAMLLGIKIPENFLQPYLSTTIQEFWKRWHISLMKWFTDYVYIPLGGNRVSRERWVCNILVVFFISGLWHGAAWHFVLWGIYNGVLVILSRFIHPLKQMPFPKAKHYLSVFLTFHMVLVGWILFRAKDFQTVVAMLNTIKHVNLPSIQISQSFLYVLLLLMFYVFAGIVVRKIRNKQAAFVIRSLGYGIAMILIILSMGMGTQFIYFQF